jgi:predicted metal-dependent HD superfamily phosphohydrolase
MRWSGYAIACSMAVMESRQDMVKAYKVVATAIWNEMHDMFSQIEAQQNEMARSDGDFQKFLAGVVKENPNG